MANWHECSCGCRALNYDAFEDMYYCFGCKGFSYPEEVGMPSNENAGYLKLGKNIKVEEE